ncbi:Hypothetical predicted protein [Paramuricea clavata]|uniref:Uncharacterized protein n=1 Tax=Paramuricea clavata TaxID=317549 RepID=A0A7D9JTD0_PARCT|nr:Hypothetical predicted protein [Paramuricea clavata]
MAKAGLTRQELSIENLVLKHEAFTSLITDNREFEKEVLSESRRRGKYYIESVVKPAKDLSNNVLQSSGMIGMSGMQSEESALELTTSQNTASVDISEQSVNDESSNIVNNMSSTAPSQENVPVENQVNHNVAPDQSPVNTQIGTTINASSCGFQMEKPKLSVCRRRARDKPLDLINGIGSDYDAAWEYLDSIYGDVRYVSDTITQDIVQLKALQEGDDCTFLRSRAPC